ncbi:MAG: SCO family protein [Caldilineaceae bacterium]
MELRKGSRLWPLLFLLILFGGCAPKHTFTGMVFDDLKPVGELVGTSHTGEPFSLADLRGKLVLVFFGYTFCPDVCPLTLSDVGEAMRMIAKDDPKSADSLAALFVTIDPERDTVERLAQYVPAFHPDIIGVVVEPSLLDEVKSNFGVYAAKSEVSQSSEAGYLMDHTAGIYVVDRQGNLLALFSHDTPADVLAGDLEVLLKR